MDCYLLGDLEHVFDQSFDIAVTKLKRENNISTAIIFMKVNKNVRRFLNSWKDRVDQLGISGERHSNMIVDQYTFSKTVYEYTDLKYLDLDPRKFNRKIKDIVRTPQQRTDLANDKGVTLVLHFYHQSFKNPDNVKEVLEIIGVNH